MGQYGVTFKGMGVALPPTVIHNDDLTKLVDTSDEWIYTRTGFKNRHMVQGDETVIDLAVESAQKALAYAGITAEEIDLIILASSTPDHIYPAGSAQVQHRLGAVNAFGFDTAMGCSGLMSAIGIGTQFIENGTSKNALIIGADTHSRFIDWTDRNTCVLFGDAAGAYILSRQENGLENDMLAMDFLMDGARGDLIKLPVQRDNCPLVAPRTETEKSAIYMNGREVFKFAVSQVPLRLELTLEKARLTPQDVDHYILHQANDRIITAMVERMNVDPDKLVISLENYGNTSCATIPLAMNDAITEGKVKPGDTIVFCGFGAGLTITTLVAKWNAVDKRNQSNKSTLTGQNLSISR